MRTIIVFKQGQWIDEAIYNSDQYSYLGTEYMKFNVDDKMTELQIDSFVFDYCLSFFIDDL